MTAELVRGQNHPLPQSRLEIRVTSERPVIAGATLNDQDGRMREEGWIAHPAQPQLPGLEVSRQAAAEHRLAVDLDALPESVHCVNVLLALPAGAGGPVRFGELAPPFVTVTGLDGAGVANCTLTGLDAESAVLALELYRRQGGWKVRAVGQGYAGGLSAMLADQGLGRAQELAATINEAVAAGRDRSVAPPPPRTDGERSREAAVGAAGSVAASAPDSGAGVAGAGDAPISYRHPGRATTPPSGPPPSVPSSPGTSAAPGRTPAAASATPGSPGSPGSPEPGPHVPVAGDANGWSMDERLYNQIWDMFEDLARTVAAYRSAVDFAESRMEQELDKVLSDPRTRVGPAADAARGEARTKQARLVEQAREVLDRDLGQLSAEAEVVEPALPPAYARWDNPVWHGYRPPLETPMAMRLGDLALPESAGLRIPMLVRLPLERGLWIDSGRSGTSGSSSPGPAAASVVSSDELRRLAAETATAVAARLAAVHPAGDFTLHVIDPAGSASAALAPLVESGVLPEPPAAGAAGVSTVLEQLTRRVDLVQMAVRSRATDALPADLDTAEQLLVVHDFPHGFDDRAVTQLRYLADEGPSVGVHLMMVADLEDARAYGPVLSPLWRALLRITPVPDDHLADPWVGHHWTYEPPLVPPGSQVLTQVLGQVASERARRTHEAEG
ncbi:export associated protein [Streptomyces abyssalis]|uniref:Export associated protein n=1 Tax=Streptomyces abyssalis TaxID=933944 RepID=A0A1E7JLC0_9ACTN|nr:TerD family protein [Streptomyces abyssalis]OEU88409.1 export associated protein [Streptomyces abyssalis]OEU89147.1 export associated protein [Streptomyces abyssalis]